MPSFLRLSGWFLPLLDSSGLRSMSALRSPRLVVGRRRPFLESVSRLDAYFGTFTEREFDVWKLGIEEMN